VLLFYPARFFLIFVWWYNRGDYGEGEIKANQQPNQTQKQAAEE
jgi:hypothetical protein